MNKYEITNEVKEIYGTKLYRIKAVKDFGYIKSGESGGWIESEKNLSHDNNAWVYGNAVVFGDAVVSGNARVCDDAEVYGNAVVCGNARVFGDAVVSGNAVISGDAVVFGDADILWISKIGSRNDAVTFVKSKDSKIIVKNGSFQGALEEFETKVKETHGSNEDAKSYELAIELAKLRLSSPQ